jgi:type IV secretory pathway VirB10-like protein
VSEPGHDQPQRNAQRPDDPLAVLLPRATRFRRGLVWGSLGAGGVLMAGVLAYGFMHSNNASQVAKAQPNASGLPPATPHLGDYPKDYSDVKPAAPSGLAAVQPVSQPAAAPARGPGQPTEQDKARASNVFFAQAPNNQATAPITAPSSQDASASPGQADASLYGDKPLPAEAQGGLAMQKNAFLANAGGGHDYVAKPLQSPISPYEIKAGTVLPAALITGINSDLPGQIIAQVTENVFDTATGRYLLVPQGSRLIGKYDSLVSYGQDRALVVWSRLILPNGSSIDLEGMPGGDETGAAGLQDETDHHRWAFAGALAVSTVLSLGPAIGASLAESVHSGSTTNVFAGPASTLGSNSSQVGENLLNRELNRPNTITVRPGWALNVLVNRDLVMRSYTNG